MMRPSNVESSFEGSPYLIAIDMEDHLRTCMVRAMHVHDDRIEILLIRQGTGVHTVGGTTYMTGPGDILVYNAGVAHDECADPKDGMDIFSCSIGGVKFHDLPAHTLFAPQICPVIQDGVYAAELEALLSVLYMARLSKEPRDKEMTEHLLYLILLLVRKAAEQHATPSHKESEDWAKEIQNYIDAHYLEDITVADISEALHTSRYYLSHVFKRAFGYSPMQYVIRRRIGEAQSWLLMSDKSVTDIAYLVGYNSASNFNNAFQKMIGISPQRYREHWRGRKK